MKAEISHHGFLEQNKYTGVYLQQGTMITDRDYNALCERLKAQINGLGNQTVTTGVPRHGGLVTGFKEINQQTHKWEATMNDTGGYVVADGVIGEALPLKPGVGFSYNSQADLPGTHKLSPPEENGNTRKIAPMLYADIWDEVITAFDDQDLLDPGLHGAHTSFVTRRRVQIKRCLKEHVIKDVAEDEKKNCGSILNPEFMPSIGSGIFKVKVRKTNAGKDECDPCAETVDIDQDIGNYLFRIEVHNVIYNEIGRPISVVLKWSMENGAREFPIPKNGAELDPNYSYEFFTEETDLNMGLPPRDYLHRPGRGKLINGSETVIPSGFTRMRRWDGFVGLTLNGAILGKGWDKDREMTKDAGANAHGQIKFSAGAFTFNLETLEVKLKLRGEDILTGDYWLALARSATKDKIRALSDTPIGIRHHYCVLGESEDGKTLIGLDPADKRRLNFPSLTCLQAGDIGFQQDCNSSLFKGENPQNVDEALKLLCYIQAEDIGYRPSCKHTEHLEIANVKEALDEFCHKSLRMSEGTGQEGWLGKTLPGPIKIFVEDQYGRPVKEADVRLIAPNKDILENALENSAANPSEGQTITLTSNGDGYVSAWWNLHGNAGIHRVSAELVDAPQGKAGKLYYTALAKKKKTSRFPTIKRVEWVNAQLFRNDDFVEQETLKEGFFIHFSEELNSDLISSDVVTLTYELPNHDSFLSLLTVVHGEATATGNVLHFKPGRKFNSNSMDLFRGPQTNPADVATTGSAPVATSAATIANIATAARAIAAGPVAAPENQVKRLEYLRFRIKVHGRFVFNKENVPVDAFVPGIPKKEEEDEKENHRIALNYHAAGLGHPSDFEAWFYLKPQVKQDTIRDIAVNTITAEKLKDLNILEPGQIEILIERQGRWQNFNKLQNDLKLTETQIRELQPRFSFDGFESEPGRTGTKIDFATVKVADLQKIEGIGPVTAQKIIDQKAAGTIKKAADLDNIGLSANMVTALKKSIVFGRG